MKSYPCKYLKGEVELSEERLKHLTKRHPDFLPAHEAKIGEVLSEPDSVRRSKRFPNARLFTRSYTDVANGKFIVIVVVTDNAPKERHWIITGYIARKISEGEIEWQRR